ncbi:CopG family transcriptional regulator [Rhizobium sp. R634]|uniref:CopG family ribbon-helix-helix protein n=1 Tax=Rhizobium sp. R634 TaxID=1764274 RepID=UPI000B52B10D|nr:CopG family ribbon-helix-helix protein [Rhizobium sp. R634]OWV81793.1 CopG family transcriptional regulator [Rhizobium sp. R634]
MGSPTSLKLDDELKGRVQQFAQYVEREEKRETLDAWDEFQATGRHVTGDEVANWLSTWGTDEELPTPECHK